MDTQIYVMTHKEYQKPDDDMYKSMHVGKALGNNLGYPGDDTGDNISSKNKSYCELTGLYWLWKNMDCDIIGICHYHRYFVKDEDFITKAYIENTLQQYDMIVPQSISTEYPNLQEHYTNQRLGEYMLICKDIISEKYPEYLDSFDICMNSNLYFQKHMMITRKHIFNEYCTWLFSILSEAEQRIDSLEDDSFQLHIMEHVSTLLLRIWILNHTYKIREEKILKINPQDSNNSKKTVELKYKYVNLIIQDLIQCYKSGNYIDVAEHTPFDIDFHQKTPVWVCWWQGEEQAPEIVKLCINSIRQHLPSDKTELHIITFENVAQYITLPSWILDHFHAGRISLTLLSDILRSGLLYRYGGMWLDATYLMVRPFPDQFFDTTEFYTQKYEQPLWRADISQSRWACNLLKMSSGNILPRFVLNAFYFYFLKQEELIDYYLIDHFIAAAYDNIPEVRQMIDLCPCSQPHILDLQPILNNTFNDKLYNELLSDTCIFKLSHKMSVSKTNPIGKETFYGHIYNTFSHVDT